MERRQFLKNMGMTAGAISLAPSLSFSEVLASASIASIIVAFVHSIWLEELASLRMYIKIKKSTSGNNWVIPSNFHKNKVASLAFLIILGDKGNHPFGGNLWGINAL